VAVLSNVRLPPVKSVYSFGVRHFTITAALG
jgi:hypothetical protein